MCLLMTLIPEPLLKTRTTQGQFGTNKKSSDRIGVRKLLQEHSTVMGDVKARDWIAVMLLQGYLAKPHETAIRTTNTGRNTAMQAARMAYQYADALLEVSAERPSA